MHGLLYFSNQLERLCKTEKVYNFLASDLGLIAAAELNISNPLYRNKNINSSINCNEGPSVTYLVHSKFLGKKLENNFVIFQGAHTTLKQRLYLDLILPTTSIHFERDSYFINAMGMIRKSNMLLVPSKNAFSDYEIFYMFLHSGRFTQLVDPVYSKFINL